MIMTLAAIGFIGVGCRHEQGGIKTGSQYDKKDDRVENVSEESARQSAEARAIVELARIASPKNNGPYQRSDYDVTYQRGRRSARPVLAAIYSLNLDKVDARVSESKGGGEVPRTIAFHGTGSGFTIYVYLDNDGQEAWHNL